MPEPELAKLRAQPMASYMAQFFEDGVALEGMGRAQLPESFTLENLSEYVERATGRRRLGFYIGGRVFEGSLQHMAAGADLSPEDVVRIDCFSFEDSLTPDHSAELAGDVTALKLADDGRLALVATASGHFYVYNIADGLAEVSRREIGEIVLQVVVEGDAVLGLTATNRILDLRENREVYRAQDTPIAHFAKGVSLVVGLDTGVVLTPEGVLMDLGSRAVFVCCTEGDKGLVLAVSELGAVARHDLATGQNTIRDLGVSVTSCTLYDGALYLGTTDAEILVVDQDLGTRTFATSFYYVDWIFACRRLCATTNFRTLLVQERESGVLRASALHDCQIACLDGCSRLLLTGAGNRICVFLAARV